MHSLRPRNVQSVVSQTEPGVWWLLAARTLYNILQFILLVVQYFSSSLSFLPFLVCVYRLRQLHTGLGMPVIHFAVHPLPVTVDELHERLGKLQHVFKACVSSFQVFIAIKKNGFSFKSTLLLILVFLYVYRLKEVAESKGKAGHLRYVCLDHARRAEYSLLVLVLDCIRSYVPKKREKYILLKRQIIYRMK